jgi:hypothetical protein
MALTLLREWFSHASFIIHGSVFVGVNIIRNKKTEKEKLMSSKLKSLSYFPRQDFRAKAAINNSSLRDSTASARALSSLMSAQSAAAVSQVIKDS